jgi:hypothetical protein
VGVEKQQERAVGAMLMRREEPFWRCFYAAWLAIAARFGHVQTLLILAIFYAFILGPISLGIAISRGDLLAKRGMWTSGSTWRKADSARPDLERARQQF